MMNFSNEILEMLVKNQMEKTNILLKQYQLIVVLFPIPFETMIVCWSQFVHESVHIAYIPTYLDISSYLSHARLDMMLNSCMYVLSSIKQSIGVLQPNSDNI